MKHDYRIETKSLRIVPMTHTDSEKFRVLRNREDNREWFIYKKEISKEEQEKWYESYLLKENDYMFAVYTNDEKKEFIGAMAIYDVENSQKKAEIGRLIIDSQKSSGKGYGYETIQGILDISFQLLKLDLIYANIYEDNIPCVKSVIKAGMTIKENKFDQNKRPMIYVEKSRLD
ncbi:MAG: GNAT family N-acetyltransferase [Bacteroidales bacterium]|nr:GNAT family N-acetyltransferase [Bacteroidales bacterium]